MTTPRQTATTMAEAAQAWLERLDDEQRPTAQSAGPADDVSEAERRRWFYTPTDHGGLALHQQRPAQQRAAMRLVAAGLSLAGYVTVATIMGLENVLDRLEGFAARFDRERGRDPGLYYLRVFGTPGDTGAWGYRFDGHHVSLNYLVADGELAAATPCFMGADPAASPLLGGVLVLLGAAVLGGAGLPRAGREQPDGVLVGRHDRPAAGEQHGLARGGKAQQVADEVVAGAGAGAVDADHDLAPEPGGDLLQGRGQHLLVVGEGVRAGVAGPQLHGQALAGIAAPGSQRVETVPFLPRGRRPFLV
jgi:hypothetical protein